MRLIYVTWDGPDQSYLESLFFPLFSRLARYAIETHVVQFSWEVERFRERVAAAAVRAGVGFEVHEVPRKPLRLATAMAITWGSGIVARAASRIGADVVMPRSHITAAMAVLANRVNAIPLVWDSDGLVADERADFGGWSRQGLSYRLYREIELDIVRRAAKTITRTEQAALILQHRSGAPKASFSVIPNGKDTTQFTAGTPEHRNEARRNLGVQHDAPLLAFVGSIGPQYRLEETLEVFAQVRDAIPTARLLMLADEVLSRAFVQKSRVPLTSVTIRRVPVDAVPNLLRAADAGFAFRQPSLSMRGVSPIKVAEYLLSGVPVLANCGIGDLDTQLSAETSVLAPDLSSGSLRTVSDLFINKLWPNRERVRLATRSVGERFFSIDVSANAYAEAVNSPHDLSPR